MIPDILKRHRHEIGVHGWIHEELPLVEDAAKEEQLLAQSIDYLASVTGKRPVGFRATNFTSGEIFAFNWSADHSRLLLARGSSTSDVVLLTRGR